MMTIQDVLSVYAAMADLTEQMELARRVQQHRDRLDERGLGECGEDDLLADVGEDRPDLVAPRERLSKLILATPNLDWLLLTKRPENIDALLPQSFRQWSRHDDGPAPHIWLGATVENQEWADKRMPALLDVHAPGVIRFASVEPLLEPVDLRAYLKPTLVARDGGERLQHPDPRVGKTGGRWSWGLDWVIVGGESGRKARPFDLAWARSVVAQCREAGVPVFVKQMGSHCVWASEDDGIAEPPYSGRIHHIDRKGGEPAEWHADLRIQEFPT